jgi:tRNA(Ile2)-agmatinylcytidine synthase
MESAGRGQGYRCRRCETKAEGRERKLLLRDLDTGFYEVPPSARRHLSKPLVRMNGEKVHPSR